MTVLLLFHTCLFLRSYTFGNGHPCNDLYIQLCSHWFTQKCMRCIPQYLLWSTFMYRQHIHANPLPFLMKQHPGFKGFKPYFILDWHQLRTYMRINATMNIIFTDIATTQDKRFNIAYSENSHQKNNTKAYDLVEDANCFLLTLYYRSSLARFWKGSNMMVQWAYITLGISLRIAYSTHIKIMVTPCRTCP